MESLPYDLREAHQEMLSLLMAIHNQEGALLADMLNGYSQPELVQLLVTSIGWLRNSTETHAAEYGMSLDVVLAAWGKHFMTLER